MSKAKSALEPRVQEPAKSEFPIADLILDDPRLQLRSDGLDEGHVGKLTEAYQEGDEVPRVRIWKTIEGNFPSDGYHRIEARLRADLDTVPALVFEGTIDEAILDAAHANAHVGLRRDDKGERNAVWAVCDVLGIDYVVGMYKKMAGVSYKQARKHYEGYLKHHNLRKPEKQKGVDDRWYKSTGWERKEEPEILSRMAPTDPRIPTTDDVIPEDADEIRIVPKMPEPGSNGVTPGGNTVTPPSNGKPARTPPPPKKVSKEELAERQQRVDREWLDGLERSNGRRPLREVLPEKKVQGYEQEALAYRDLMQSEYGKMFLAKAEVVLGIKRGDKARGPFARLIGELMLLDHPRDWNLCGKCKGSGRYENGPCPTCKDSAGYVL